MTTWSDGEGGSGGRGHMYACGQFMMIYGKNHHNIVNIFQYKKYIYVFKEKKGTTGKKRIKFSFQRGEKEFVRIDEINMKVTL